MSLKKLYREAIELKVRFKSSPFESVVYHGNTINQDYEDAISTIVSEFKDFGATWFSKSQEFAEEFAREYYNGNADDQVMVVYKCIVRMDNCLYIDYEKYQEIINIDTEDSLKSYIPVMKQLGYDGYVTEGDFNGKPYDDIGVFYPEKQVEVQQAKLYNGDRWTPYFDLHEVNTLVKFTSLIDKYDDG